MLVAQKLGQVGKELIDDEAYHWQFTLLVAAAAAYVTSAWWIVVVRPPLGRLICSVTDFIF